MFVIRLVIGLAIFAGCGRLGFDTADAGAVTDDTGLGAGDAARVACGATGQVFCDNLESANLASWSDPPTGAAAWQTGTTHSGHGALQVTTDGRQVSYIGTALDPVASGSIHARAWFYMPSDVALNKIDIYSLNGSDSGLVFLIDKNELRVYNAASGGATVTTGVLAPRDRWFCIEIHVAISPTAGAIQLDLDGEPVGAIRTGLDTSPGGGYAHLSIGMSFVVRPQSAVTFYIDDVAAGVQPIGCS